MQSNMRWEEIPLYHDTIITSGKNNARVFDPSKKALATPGMLSVAAASPQGPEIRSLQYEATHPNDGHGDDYSIPAAYTYSQRWSFPLESL